MVPKRSLVRPPQRLQRCLVATPSEPLKEGWCHAFLRQHKAFPGSWNGVGLCMPERSKTCARSSLQQRPDVTSPPATECLHQSVRWHYRLPDRFHFWKSATHMQIPISFQVAQRAKVKFVLCSQMVAGQKPCTGTFMLMGSL